MCGTNLKQFYKKVKFQSTDVESSRSKKEILVNVVTAYLMPGRLLGLYGPLPNMTKNV